MPRRTTALLSVVIVVVLLGGLYYWLRNSRGGFDPGSAAPAATATPGEPRAFSLSIPAKSPQPPAFPVFQVAQGQAVTLEINSARPGSVHVHIYEKQIDLTPGAEVDLTFRAVNAGRFPIHLHDPSGAMEHLATLEVQPR